MYTDEKQFELAMVVEPVDNWHPRWVEVLDAIDQSGERESLGIDADGWLPARQVLLVAFIDEEIAGHISFGVQPTGGKHIEAQLGSRGVQWKFNDRPVEHALLVAARRRARLLGCRRLVGFDLPGWQEQECCLGACCS